MKRPAWVIWCLRSDTGTAASAGNNIKCGSNGRASRTHSLNAKVICELLTVKSTSVIGNLQSDGSEFISDPHSDRLRVSVT